MSDAVDQFETAHIRKAEIDDHAIDMIVSKYRERLLSGSHSYRVQVAVAEQLDDRLALTFVIFDYQNGPGALLNERSKTFNRMHQRIMLNGLFEIPDRAQFQREAALIKDGND